jgi:hypothetical protein
MTSAVWAGTVFGPHLWLLSARHHLLAGSSDQEKLLKFETEGQEFANLFKQ